MKKIIFLLLLLFYFCNDGYCGFSVKAGSFSLNTSTGDQSVTGLGFQPKLIIFSTSVKTADGSHSCSGGVGSYGAVGAAVSSSSRFAFSHYISYASKVYNTSFDTDEAIVIYGAGAYNTEADFVSMDSDGFTINLATAPASAWKVGYIAFGGSDISVATGTFDSTTSTSTDTNVTSAGFAPDIVFVFGGREDTTEGGTSGYAGLIEGVGTSSSSRANVSYVSSGSTNQSSYSYANSSSIVSQLTQASSTMRIEGDLESMDGSGFTIDWSTVQGSAARFGYIAISGLEKKVGSFTSLGSTGDKAVTGVGFQPTATILLIKHPASEGTGATSSYAIGFGAASGASAEFSAQAGGNASIGGASCGGAGWSGSDIYRNVNCAFGTATVALADMKSFDADGFTLNYTDADDATRNIYYASFSESSSGSSVSTVNGLTKSSVSTKNGLSNASVGTWNGLA